MAAQREVARELAKWEAQDVEWEAFLDEMRAVKERVEDAKRRKTQQEDRMREEMEIAERVKAKWSPQQKAREAQRKKEAFARWEEIKLELQREDVRRKAEHELYERTSAAREAGEKKRRESWDASWWGRLSALWKVFLIFEGLSVPIALIDVTLNGMPLSRIWQIPLYMALGMFAIYGWVSLLSWLGWIED